MGDPVVIVEGYCLLHDARVCDLLQGLIWVDIDEKTCKQRRTSYPRGWDHTAYFDECIWPAHSRYQELVFGCAHDLGVAGKSACFAERTLLLFGTDRSHTL